jgi:predicted ArsR family transcriptional regulator
MAAGRSPEIHKALADDTRFRLYRYIRLAARPVSVPEMSARLSLHPNTIRPHLRRLEEAGLVTHEIRKGGSAGRPRTLYLVREPADEESRDYRLLAEMLCGLVTGKRAMERALGMARDWGAYLVAQGKPKPGARPPAGLNLAVLQEALARAGFDPRFRRTGGKAVEITLRDCPFRDLADEHRELVCTLHRGLLEGIVGGVSPPLSLRSFRPFVERNRCLVTAG